MPDISQHSVRGLLDAISARTPSPGGGAVAGLTAALAAAIGHMSLAYSVRKDTGDADRRDLEAALAELSGLVTDMLDRCGQDEAAYGEVNRLQRLDKNDPERAAKWAEAVTGAIAAPMAMMEGGCRVLETISDVADRCSPRLVSDLAVSAILAEASVRAAGLNVNVNLPLVSDGAEHDRVQHDMRRNIERAKQVFDSVRRGLNLDAALVAPF